MTKEAPTDDEIRDALVYGKLAGNSYHDKDWQVAELGIGNFKGDIIDGILQQDFTVPEYKVLAKEGDFLDLDSGLDYTIYEHVESKNLIIAFRGTEPLSPLDWLQDMKQCLGKSEQYEKAVVFAKKFVSDHTQVNISFTGHSLGGGLATAAALATGKEAIVFDAAGISKKTMKKARALGISVHNQSHVKNYNVQECFVSDHNGRMDRFTLSLPFTISKQYGKQYWLKSISNDADFMGWAIPDDNILVKKLKTYLAHAWHLYVYQLEHKHFVEGREDRKRKRYFPGE